MNNVLSVDMSVAELQSTEEWQEGREGEQVMPEIKVTDIMEDEYKQISEEVPVTGPEAHTAVHSEGDHATISDCIMTVLHTPLLGTLCTQNTQTYRRTDNIDSS